MPTPIPPMICEVDIYVFCLFFEFF
jgi:hypothetical protein